MALKHLERIARLLVAGGLDARTPAAIVARASTDAQRVVETTLGDAARDAVAAGIEPPALFVVGDVVRLRAGLDWLGAAQGRILDSDPLGRGNAESA
jgi:uroporphyrin-III C-methyltransferase